MKTWVVPDQFLTGVSNGLRERGAGTWDLLLFENDSEGDLSVGFRVDGEPLSLWMSSDLLEDSKAFTPEVTDLVVQAVLDEYDGYAAWKQRSA